MARDNRGEAKVSNDTWLTPKGIVDLLGPFDLDPCCPPTLMSWRTANYMIHWSGAPGEVPHFPANALQANAMGDGLALDWSRFGRTWCNFPYSWCNFPYSESYRWIEKMAAHRKGMLLAPGKSPDTKWGQLLLDTADLVFFPKGRLAFCHEDGTPSTGKWNPNVFAAYGMQDQDALIRLAGEMPGVLMTKATRKLR